MTWRRQTDHDRSVELPAGSQVGRSGHPRSRSNVGAAPERRPERMEGVTDDGQSLPQRHPKAAASGDDFERPRGWCDHGRSRCIRGRHPCDRAPRVRRLEPGRCHGLGQPTVGIEVPDQNEARAAVCVAVDGGIRRLTRNGRTRLSVTPTHCRCQASPIRPRYAILETNSSAYFSTSARRSESTFSGLVDSETSASIHGAHSRSVTPASSRRL